MGASGRNMKARATILTARTARGLPALGAAEQQHFAAVAAAAAEDVAAATRRAMRASAAVCIRAPQSGTARRKACGGGMDRVTSGCASPPALRSTAALRRCRRVRGSRRAGTGTALCNPASAGGRRCCLPHQGTQRRTTAQKKKEHERATVSQSACTASPRTPEPR